MASPVRRLLCLVTLAVGLVADGVAAPARAADTLRCGNRLVRDGDTQDEVFRRCGKPAFRNFSTELISFETASGFVVTKAVPVETWTYNRGPREFVRYLKFRDGRLVRIVAGGYGY
jgi:hypothetical protein